MVFPYAGSCSARSACSTARASSTRDETPTLRKMLRRWVSTVFWLRKSSAAISRVRLAVDHEAGELQLALGQRRDAAVAPSRRRCAGRRCARACAARAPPRPGTARRRTRRTLRRPARARRPPGRVSPASASARPASTRACAASQRVADAFERLGGGGCAAAGARAVAASSSSAALARSAIADAIGSPTSSAHACAAAAARSACARLPAASRARVSTSRHRPRQAPPIRRSSSPPADSTRARPRAPRRPSRAARSRARTPAWAGMGPGVERLRELPALLRARERDLELARGEPGVGAVEQRPDEVLRVVHEPRGLDGAVEHLDRLGRPPATQNAVPRFAVIRGRDRPGRSRGAIAIARSACRPDSAKWSRYISASARYASASRRPASSSSESASTRAAASSRFSAPRPGAGHRGPGGLHGERGGGEGAVASGSAAAIARSPQLVSPSQSPWKSS